MKRYRFCILEIIIGLLMVVLGIVALVRPSELLGDFIRIFAAMAVISGVRDIMFYCKAGRYTGVRSVLSLVTSIVGIMTGIIFFIYPGAGTIIISLFIPLWFISHSLFQIVSLDIIRNFMTENHYRFSLIVGIIGLILGVITLLHPLLSSRIIMAIIGLYLIVTGITSIVIGVSKIELHV